MTKTFSGTIKVLKSGKVKSTTEVDKRTRREIDAMLRGIYSGLQATEARMDIYAVVEDLEVDK